MVPPVARHHHLDPSGGPEAHVVGHAPSMTLPPPAEARIRSGRRWPVIVSALALLIVVAVFVAGRVTVDYYSLTPGDAQAVGPLVKVPPGKGHPVHGSILLTDVLVTRLTVLGYLSALVDPNAEIVSAADLLGPNTPPDQLVTQGYLEMAQSQSAAKVAALSRLGYQVPEHDAGALVFGVQPRSPAASSLKLGQIIEAVDSVPTPDSCSLIGALAAYRPGQQVRLAIEQSRVTPNAVIVPGRVIERTVRLASAPPGTPRRSSAGCPGAPASRGGYLGVVVETQQDFTYPFPISIDTREIGGPSAGLAMTLAVVDELSGGRLTGGRTVAATGTISPDGSVGPVGGVAQKTVAVERAGATVFFVPSNPEQVAAARSKATKRLRVFPVDSLDQAVAELERLGGQGPPIPQGHASTP